MATIFNLDVRQVAATDQHNQAVQPNPVEGKAEQNSNAFSDLRKRVSKQTELLMEHESFQNNSFFVNRSLILGMEKQIEGLRLQITILQQNRLDHPQIKALKIQIEGLQDQIISLEKVAATKEDYLAKKLQADLPENAPRIDEAGRDAISLSSQSSSSNYGSVPLLSRLISSKSKEASKKEDPLSSETALQMPTIQQFIIGPQSRNSVELKKWKRGNQDIILLRDGDTLKYQIFNKTTNQIGKQGNVDVTPLIKCRDVTVEQQIVHLTYSHPIIGVTGEIRWGEFDDVPSPPPINEQEKAELIAYIQKNKSGYQLCHASESLKDNKDLVLAVIQVDYRALCFASDRLKNDEEVVFVAVRQNSRALKHASERLKGDKDTVRAALWQDPWEALRSAGEALKDDKEFMLFVIKKYPKQYGFASDRLMRDKDVVLAILQHSPQAFWRLNNQLQHDADVLATFKKAQSPPSCSIS